MTHSSRSLSLFTIAALLTTTHFASAAESPPYVEPPPPRAFRFGPTVSMGAPNGVTGGVTTKFKDLVGLDFGASYVPWLSITHDAKVQRTGFEGDLRVYPTRGAFYLGCAGGYAKLVGAGTQSLGAGTAYAQTASARATMDYAFVRPEIGFLAVFDNHMFIGSRLGVDIPVTRASPDVVLNTSQGTYNVTTPNGATTALRFVGTHALPTLTLFEVGFMI